MSKSILKCEKEKKMTAMYNSRGNCYRPLFKYQHAKKHTSLLYREISFYLPLAFFHEFDLLICLQCVIFLAQVVIKDKVMELLLYFTKNEDEEVQTKAIIGLGKYLLHHPSSR